MKLASAVLALAFAQAVQIVVYEFANCTGKVESNVYLTSGRCTPVSGSYTVAMQSCSPSKVTLAFFSEAGCAQPVSDALYDIPNGQPDLCVSYAPTYLSMQSQKGMKVVNSACTVPMVQVGAYSSDDAACSGSPFVTGLFPASRSAEDSCWVGTTGSRRAFEFGANDGTQMSVEQWFGTATCNASDSTSFGSATAQRDVCTMLVDSSTVVRSVFKWGDAAAFDASSASALPAGIPTASLVPLRCWTTNSSDSANNFPTLLPAMPDDEDNLCLSGSIRCRPGIPQGVIDLGVCTAADIAAGTKVIPFYMGTTSTSWQYLQTTQISNCTADGGSPSSCLLYQNLAFCNTDGCNRPPTSGAGPRVAAAPGAGLAGAVVAALVAVLAGRVGSGVAGRDDDEVC